MTAVANLTSLYAVAPIVLWVEDSVTRDYLSKVWGDPPTIAFLIAGGSDAIPPAVEAAEREGIGHVFGLRDRDFRRAGGANWLGGGRVFTLPRHEIENYALNPDAICGCALHNRRRSADDIRGFLQERAAEQTAWLACRRVLNDIQRDLLDGFPAHRPITDVADIAAAERHIVASPWFGRLSLRSYRWARPGAVADALRAAEAEYNAALTSGAWQSEFSGKELFRPVRDYVYQPPQNSGHPDSDFAKAIGDWQYNNAAVPADLTNLRAALRARVGHR